MRTLSAYRLVDVLAAVVAMAGWRPVAGTVTRDRIRLEVKRKPLRDRSDEHDLSGPEDHG